MVGASVPPVRSRSATPDPFRHAPASAPPGCPAPPGYSIGRSQGRRGGPPPRVV